LPTAVYPAFLSRPAARKYVVAVTRPDPVSPRGQRSSIRSMTIGWSIPSRGSRAVFRWSSTMVRRWNAESSLISSGSIGLGVETRLWTRVRET
jgi:hypothetical protein